MSKKYYEAAGQTGPAAQAAQHVIQPQQSSEPEQNEPDDRIDLGDLSPAKLGRYKIRGKDYVLNEANENAASAFRNAHFRSMRLTAENKMAAMDGAAEADAELLAACLKDSETGKPGFKADFIRQWPSRVVQEMLRKVQRASGMLPEEEKPADPTPAPAAQADGGAKPAEDTPGSSE
jgi:hypothetical protein